MCTVTGLSINLTRDTFCASSRCRKGRDRVHGDNGRRIERRHPKVAFGVVGTATLLATCLHGIEAHLGFRLPIFSALYQRQPNLIEADLWTQLPN